MAQVAAKTYTSRDLLNDPTLARFELVHGHLVERTTSERSSAIGGNILRLLSNDTKKTREATVYSPNLGYNCFRDSITNVRFPDVSLIRASRKQEVGDDPEYMPIPADLVVEVLSPNDVVKNVGDKIKDYLKAGFGLIWVVDPDWKNVHIYRRDGSVQLLSENDEITGESALPGFRARSGNFSMYDFCVPLCEIGCAK